MKKILILTLCAWILQSCANFQTIKKEAHVLAAMGAADVHGGKSWSPRLGGQVDVETKIHQLVQDWEFLSREPHTRKKYTREK